MGIDRLTRHEPMSNNEEPHAEHRDTRTREQQPDTLLLKNLTEDEVGTLRVRIERLKGHVRLIVHPLYFETNTKEDYRNELRHFEKSIRNTYGEVLSAPLFIFEGVTDLQATRKRIADSLETSEESLAMHGIVLVPTNDDEGIPHETAFSGDIQNYEIESRWDALSKAFRQLGITSMTASGMYIQYNQKDAALDLCLGSVVQALRERGFHVDISSAIVNNKESLKVNGIEIKQTKKVLDGKK
jgi:hypothetical protein